MKICNKHFSALKVHDINGLSTIPSSTWLFLCVILSFLSLAQGLFVTRLLLNLKIRNNENTATLKTESNPVQPDFCLLKQLQDYDYRI